MGIVREIVQWTGVASLAWVVPAMITAALDDNHHQEYHYSGSVGAQSVYYDERNPNYFLHLSYEGVLSVRENDGSGYSIVDRNNNLKLDDGDYIVIIGSDGRELKFKLDMSNQNLAGIARDLQPKMDATLDTILAANTAMIR